MRRKPIREHPPDVTLKLRAAWSQEVTALLTSISEAESARYRGLGLPPLAGEEKSEAHAGTPKRANPEGMAGRPVGEVPALTRRTPQSTLSSVRLTTDGEDWHGRR